MPSIIGAYTLSLRGTWGSEFPRRHTTVLALLWRAPQDGPVQHGFPIPFSNSSLNEPRLVTHAHLSVDLSTERSGGRGLCSRARLAARRQISHRAIVIGSGPSAKAEAGGSTINFYWSIWKNQTTDEIGRRSNGARMCHSPQSGCLNRENDGDAATFGAELCQRCYCGRGETWPVFSPLSGRSFWALA